MPSFQELQKTLLEDVPVEILAECSDSSVAVLATFADTFEAHSQFTQDQAREGLSNPPLMRLLGFERTQENLRLTIGATTYPEFVKTRQLQVEKHERLLRLANPLGVCCVCLSADGKLLIEKRGHTVGLYKGGFHVVGGYADLTHDVELDQHTGHWEPRPDFAILREIREEMNIPTNLSVHNLRPTVLAYDTTNQHPELCFFATINLHSREIVDLARQTAEFQNINLLDAEVECVSEFLKVNRAKVVPTGLAAMLYSLHLL